LIRDTVGKARTLAPTTVAGAPPGRLRLIRNLLPDGVPLIPQPEGDLGDRMLDGVRTVFHQSSEPVVVLGTDAPTLRPSEILKSARALNTHDISIIQSTDGGYVLLGLRRPVDAIFSGIEWSTDAVYQQTLARAEEAGLSVYEGVAWYDVDEPDDLARLWGELGACPELAPRTAEVLRLL
jgi:rSAM/selenodomain-associated transferase 1